MYYLKVLKIFLGLKCREIAEFARASGIFMLYVLAAVVACIVSVLILSGIGWLVCLIDPSIEISSELPYAGVGISAIILIAIAVFAGYVIFKFFKWIGDNWQYSKAKANRELGISNDSGENSTSGASNTEGANSSSAYADKYKNVDYKPLDF